MYGMWPTTLVLYIVAPARDHGDFVCHAATHSRERRRCSLLSMLRQTSTSPISLDHAHLPINVVSSNNRFNCEWTRVTTGAYNRNINKRQVCKLIWHAMVRKFYNSKYYF